MKKDFFGVMTDVGDPVAFIEPSYHNLTSGIMTKVTPKGIKVKYTRFYDKCEVETFVYEGEFVRYPDVLPQ